MKNGAICVDAACECFEPSAIFDRIDDPNCVRDIFVAMRSKFDCNLHMDILPRERPERNVGNIADSEAAVSELVVQGRASGLPCLPVPWKKVCQATDWIFRDAAQDIGQPCLRIDIIEPAGLDQRIDDGGTLSAAI